MFDALHEVERYERDNFGEVTATLSAPEEVANMLWYIIGENVVAELFQEGINGEDVWNECATDETNATLIERINEMLEE